MALVITNCTYTAFAHVLDGCCCEYECDIESTYEECVVISSMANSTTGDPNNSIVVTEIDGVPFIAPSGVPLPYTLGALGTVNFKFIVCGTQPPTVTTDILSITYSVCPDVTGLGNVKLHNTRIHPDTVCDMVTIDGVPYPATMDFGFVVAGSSQQVLVDIENPTGCDWTVNFSDDCSDPQLTYNQPNPFVIPAFTTMTLIATWSPMVGTVGTLACQLSLDVVDDDECTGSCDLDITGISGALPCLTCDNIEYFTEGDYLDLVPNLCTITPLSFIHGAIGERKSMSFYLNYGNGLQTGVKLYFNPMLFSYDCDWLQYYASGVIDDPMSTSWFIEYVAGMPLVSPMNIVNAGGNTENNRNFECQFHNINPPYEFMIRIIYYNICDMDEPLTSTAKQNNPKLIVNTRYNPMYFDNSDACVYNQMKKWCAMTYLIDPNIQTPDPVTQIIGDFECYHLDSVPITQRFYDTGLLHAPAEMTDHLFTVERNGTPKDKFSTLNETDVTFKIEHTSAPTQLVIWLIDWNNFDDTITFYENYNSSRTPINTNVLPVVLDNSISAPSTALTNVSPNTYEGTFKVNTSVTSGGVYYIIAVVYDKVNDIVNSFVSKQYGVTDLPDDDTCCSIGAVSNYTNYYDTFMMASGLWFTSTVTERLKISMLNISQFGSAPTMHDCITSWGGDAVNWQNYITKYEFQVHTEHLDFPSVGETTYVIYDKATATRIGVSPLGFSSNNPKYKVIDMNFGLLNAVSMEYELRTRWEEQIVPTMAQVQTTGDFGSRVNVGAMASTYINTLGATYDWSGKTIYFETFIHFDFQPIFGSPLDYVVRTEQKMEVIGFDSGFLMNEIKLFKDDGVTELNQVFCNTETNCIIVRVHKTYLVNNNQFIALFDQVQSSAGTIREENPIYPDGQPYPEILPLLALKDDAICNVDTEFDLSNHAYFKVDISQLQSGQYIFIGMAYQPVVGITTPIPNLDLNCNC